VANVVILVELLRQSNAEQEAAFGLYLASRERRQRDGGGWIDQFERGRGGLCLYRDDDHYCTLLVSKICFLFAMAGFLFHTQELGTDCLEEAIHFHDGDENSTAAAKKSALPRRSCHCYVFTSF
jgi:hypothetical protein